MTAPSFGQIKAQVAAIRQKVPNDKAIGIHSPGRWTGESVQHDGDQKYVIQQCDSPLAVRLALRQPTADNTTTVLITSLDEHDLSDDILLRLAKRKLFQIDPWQIVRALFDAHAVDPRLTKHSWIAESLLELIPRDGYPAAAGGFLDAETVWPLLLGQAMGLFSETPDLTALLDWSLDATATAQFRSCPEDFREGAVGWLTEKAGPLAEIVLHCIARLERPDAVPIGLVADVVFHPKASGKLEKATGRLEERFLHDLTVESGLMQRWASAATKVVRGLRETDAKSYRQTLQRADEILHDIQADSYAFLSDTSPLGFDQRLARVGTRLSAVLEHGSWNLADELLESQQEVRRHDLSGREVRRMERVDMALRLVRWMGGRHHEPPAEPQSLPEAANEQMREGGFVDWARLSLRSVEPVRELSEAYASLFEQVTQIREQQAQVFAQLLSGWTAAGSLSDEVIPVERILEEVVAQLAASGLVLVIVVDGMSVAVCRELLADVTRHEWIALCEPERTFNRPGISTIPSRTEFARASLLCGTLRQGYSDDEKRGFAEHPTMVARSRSGSPPILFHKAALAESADTELAKDVRNAIQSSHRRIVGVVVNAVDDHLAKGDQIDTRWTRDEIKVLPALLHDARIARRFVVLVSDHGHILDCQAELRPGEGGERWRAAEGEPASDELLVEGSRVLTSGHRLIAPWSERVRYVQKKNGYHGGLTPQEMVVPIAVLSSTDDFPEDWREQPIDTPAWWDEPSKEPAPVKQPAPKLKPVKPKPTGTLFDLEAEEEAKAAAPDVTVPQWVSGLIACEVFDNQKKLGGRGLPPDDVFARLLSVLDQRGGKMTSVALARALQFPAVRLPGLLARAERVLNVDGYDVLRRDDASDTIELNRDLLLKQFDLV